MKNILVLAVSLLTFSIGIGQIFSTERSASFTKDKEKEVIHIAFPSAYGFMTYSHLDNVMMDNLKEIKLTKYDQTMQAVESQSFNLPKLGGRAADLMEVVELDDRLIFISKTMDKKSGEHVVYGQIYSEKENIVGDKKVLASIPIESYSKSGFYQVAISPDRSRIAVFANMPFVKKTQEKVSVSIFDTELNLNWEQIETLDFKMERAYQEEVFVSNAGELYLKKITNPFKKTRTVHLLKFNGNSVDSTIFSSEGFQPMGMKLIEADNTAMLVGFYWDAVNTVIKLNSREGDDTNGAFLYDLSQKKLVGIHKWSETLDWKDLKSLVVVDVKVVNEDIFLIGEKQLYKSEFQKKGSKTSMEMDYFYTYGSSVLVNLDTKGTLKSFTSLFAGKQYKNAQKEKGSIAALYLENGLRIFTNDDRMKYNEYFSESKATFNYSSLRPGEIGTPYLIPESMRPVTNYNLLYFITNYGGQYWFNKMSW